MHPNHSPCTHPDISILMPVRNAGNFLHSCLQSIMKQSYGNFELIAVNNGSSDDSAAILSSYLSDPRVQLLHNTAGPHEIIPALQMALAWARGRYITRMDADDIMMPHKLEMLKNKLDHAPERCIVTGSVEIFMDDGSHVGEGFLKYAAWLNRLCASEKHFDEVFKECVIPSPCWMMRRDELNGIGGFNRAQYPEDYDLCFRLYEAGFTARGVPTVMHLWRDYHYRNSRTDSKFFPENYLSLKVDYFCKLVPDANCRIVLWGAGKKGKKTAQLLSDKKKSFIWVTDNVRKQTHEIYGVPLRSSDFLIPFNEHYKIIIAVSAPDELNNIKNRLQAAGYRNNEHWFAFY